MNRQQAFQALADFRQGLLDGISERHKPYVEGAVKRLIEGAEIHLKILYDNDVEVGEGFSMIEDYVWDERYVCHVKGLHRHLDVCKRNAEFFRPAA